MRLRAPATIILLLLLAGCLGGPRAQEDSPCDEGPAADCAVAASWPAGLVGPFELGSLETLRVPSDDGVDLVGGLWMPKVPDGVKVPVLLWQSPYFGACIVHNGPSTVVDPENPASYHAFPCQPAADSMDLYDQPGRLHIRTLVEAGFAVASMNVRGTGTSGGCMDPFGERESQDSAFLVEHLAAQPWSNGRVAMAGHSYSGGTPWGAAVLNPPHLKAIVASGLVTDLYTFYHTPQGLASDLHASLLTTLVYENTAPTNPQSGDQVVWPGSERGCADYFARPAEDIPERAGLPRDEAFWEAHRYINDFDKITAAVLVSHGYQEGCPFGHCQQDDIIWDLIHSPKRFILGQWGHDLPPPPDRLENAPFGADWYEDTMVPWLDHWLKGVGPTPPLGMVDWQDDRLEWHRSDHPSAASEVLYLTDQGLTAAPAISSRQMVTSAGLDVCLADLGVLVYSVTVREPVLVHGSPVLFLDVESTMPRGLFYARLAVSDGPLVCGGTYVEHGGGAVDLRYHAGGYEPQPFPIGSRDHVRVDLGSVALSLQSGQVLSIGLSTGTDAISGEGAAMLTIRGDGTPTGSQLSLPIAAGTLGGSPPTVTYPQRPFAPEPGPFRFEG
ncbi:MAG TPA: CocE/NonD family hydrolase [Candidatus Thermoplasmatota archaeon]|nr:CocE/NonD family hydrolase [Candidatus Thermoplasmatota archaeon]